MESEKILLKEYTTPEIAKILGVSTRKVISMLERGYLKPSIQEANGHASRRLYSFDDVVRAYIILELLNFGLSVDNMRLMSGLLENYLDEPYFMINKHGHICVITDDTQTNDEYKLDFLNNPSGGVQDSNGLPDSSPVLYVPMKDMRYTLFKRISKQF